MVLLQRKLYFSKDQAGSNFFQGGGGGVNMLISIGTYITCDFPGGLDPYPPLSRSAHDYLSLLLSFCNFNW